MTTKEAHEDSMRYRKIAEELDKTAKEVAKEARLAKNFDRPNAMALKELADRSDKVAKEAAKDAARARRIACFMVMNKSS